MALAPPRVMNNSLLYVLLLPFAMTAAACGGSNEPANSADDAEAAEHSAEKAEDKAKEAEDKAEDQADKAKDEADKAKDKAEDAAEKSAP